MFAGITTARLALFDAAGELVAASPALRAFLHERPAFAVDLLEFVVGVLRAFPLDGPLAGIVPGARLTAERIARPNEYGAVLAVSILLDGVIPLDGATRARFGLTRRESEVAALLMNGRSGAEVARELGISAHTAKRHTEAVFRKLGVRRRSEVMMRLLSSDALRA